MQLISQSKNECMKTKKNKDDDQERVFSKDVDNPIEGWFHSFQNQVQKVQEITQFRVRNLMLRQRTN